MADGRNAMGMASPPRVQVERSNVRSPTPWGP